MSAGSDWNKLRNLINDDHEDLLLFMQKDGVLYSDDMQDKALSALLQLGDFMMNSGVLNTYTMVLLRDIYESLID